MTSPQDFRSAFNGFNREDVVHYIEYLNARHAAEVEQLNAELAFLRNSAPPAAEEEAQEDLSERVVGLEEALKDLRAEKEELETQLAEAMEVGEDFEKQRNEAVAERDKLAQQLEEALRQQKSVESRSAEELEAYRRAERAERMAKERADQMYRQANGVIADATVKVNEAAAQIGALSETVAAKLEQLRSAVTGTNAALKEAADVMFTIRPESEE